MICMLQKNEKPNIVFFLVDDLGWMDTSVYGSQYYETPNLERLAKRGMMFTDAYAASPLCSPTRASLMTGKYPCRLKITTPACHLPPELEPDLPETAESWKRMIDANSRRYLPLEEYTIGNAFQEAGYATGLMGKWHLGLEEKYWPRNQGFDLDMGSPNPGPPSYFPPYNTTNFPDGEQGEYITDRLTKEAIHFIKEKQDQPFFLNIWHFAVHDPYQGKEDIIDYYRKKQDPRGYQDCPTMGAMIQSMDESLGRVLDELDELGLTDKTIFVFFSDNGGNMYDQVERTSTPTNNAPLRSGKANIHEGGVRVPLIVTWPGMVEAGSKTSEVVSSVDFYPTLLEMAGIQPNPKHKLDGESIVPVLKQEGALEREAIYCHFPHYIPATDNVPSTSVRKGDWKLIRLYGEGPERSDSFSLYHLKEDIGETHDLSESKPDKVKELNELILKHLEDTEAVVPVKNPFYDSNAPMPEFDRTGWEKKLNWK